MPDVDGRIKKAAEKEIFKRWYVLTDKERKKQGFPIQQQDFKKYLGVSADTLVRWSKECREEGVYPPKKVPKIKNHWKGMPDLPPEMESAVAPLTAEQIAAQSWWTEERNKEINQAIYDSSIGKTRGNANSQKLALQASGRLVEKQEVKFVLSADDYFRIRREAQGRIQQLLGEGDGDRSVQSESALLLSQDGVSPKQEHDQDSEMAVVGLST